MKLRGLTPNRKPVYFCIDDVPVCINDSMTILARKPNSPLIISKSIMRGDDSGDFFESDFVIGSMGKFIGFVIYTDGFYIWNVFADKIIPIRKTDNYSFVQNTQMYKLDDINQRRGKLRFKCNRYSFDINKIIYYKKSEMFITVKPSGTPIILGQINFGTGIFVDNIEIHYGQVLNDGIVVLNNYHPMLKLPGGKCRELEDSDYDKVGIT